MSKKQHQTNPIAYRDRSDADSMTLVKQKSRYERARKLCKGLSRDRRHLRSKVDLLCKDLVGSNKQLVQTLGDLRFLCNFQHELMGENDLACLLHKAIQFLVAELENTSAAIFLSATRKIEAHLLGSWLPENENLKSIESILQDAVIAVCQKTKPVFPDGLNDICPYTIMGLPMMVHGELLGVVVFYRDSRDGFDVPEQTRLQSCMPSLAQQVLAVQRLHSFLCEAKS